MDVITALCAAAQFDAANEDPSDAPPWFDASRLNEINDIDSINSLIEIGGSCRTIVAALALWPQLKRGVFLANDSHELRTAHRYCNLVLSLLGVEQTIKKSNNIIVINWKKKYQSSSIDTDDDDTPQPARTASYTCKLTIAPLCRANLGLIGGIDFGICRAPQPLALNAFDGSARILSEIFADTIDSEYDILQSLDNGCNVRQRKKKYTKKIRWGPSTVKLIAPLTAAERRNKQRA